MIDVQFQLPVRLNDGPLVEDTIWNQVEEHLLHVYGGFTYLGIYRGEWLDPATGKRYKDYSRAYSVGAPSVAQVKLSLRWANQYFKQEAFAIRHSGTLEIFR